MLHVCITEDGTFDCFSETPSGTYFQVEKEPLHATNPVGKLPISMVNDIGMFQRPTMLQAKFLLWTKRTKKIKILPYIK